MRSRAVPANGRTIRGVIACWPELSGMACACSAFQGVALPHRDRAALAARLSLPCLDRAGVASIAPAPAGAESARTPFLPARPRRNRKPEKDDGGLVQSQHGLVIQAPGLRSDLRLRDGRDLVHHQPARTARAVPFARRNRQTEERRLGLVGGEGADGGGAGGVEAIIPDDDNGARPASVRPAFGWAGASLIELTDAKCETAPRCSARR